MPNVELELKRDLSSFRRIAIGTWQRSYDPSVYGTMEVPVDACLDYIERFRARTGKRVTMTHLMAKITAAALEKMPDANAILRFNRVYLRKRIGVFFQVAMEDPETGQIDLSGATIFDAEKKSLLEIYDEFAAKVKKVRAAKDPELEKTRSTFKSIPSMLLNLVLKVMALLLYTLNIDMTWAGLPKDAFGSAMVTNVGSLGLDQAYVPLVPYSRVPLLIATGAVQEKPIVVDGEVRVAHTMPLSATFDHRLVDGMHASIMSKVMRAWFADPEGHFGRIEDLPTPEDDAESGEDDAPAERAGEEEGSAQDGGEGSEQASTAQREAEDGHEEPTPDEESKSSAGEEESKGG